MENDACKHDGSCGGRFWTFINVIVQFAGGVGSGRHADDPDDPHEDHLAQSTRDAGAEQPPPLVSPTEERRAGGSRILHVSDQHGSHAAQQGLPRSARYQISRHQL